MPAKTNPKDFVDQVQWVKKLPDGGGNWGTYIVDMAEGLHDDAVEVDRKRDELNQESKNIRRVLRSIPKRAVKEAKLLFGDEAVDEAMKSVNVDQGKKG